jgi:N-acetylneuraminic acid mutarotase
MPSRPAEEVSVSGFSRAREEFMSSAVRRTFAVLATGFFVVLLATSAFTQARWTRLAPFPEPDEELYGVAAGGKMYVLGGFGGGKARGGVFEYDPAADRWTKKKPMARPVHHQAMAEYQGKIYVFGGFVFPSSGGGWEPVDNAWEYDPVADSWKALAPLPMKRGSAVAAEVGGKLYVIGGATTVEGSKETAINGNGPARVLTVNDVYDPATNTWQSRAPMALGRNHAFGGAVNGKIYVIGGRTAHAFITVSTNTDIVEEYDPATNMWAGLKAKMPTARSGGGWATYGGKIYVAGGEVSTPEVAGAFRAVEVYEPAANTWTKLPPMPMPRHGVAGAVLGNRFHLVSGMITTAAAGAGQDPKMEVHTSLHDVIELGPARGSN